MGLAGPWLDKKYIDVSSPQEGGMLLVGSTSVRGDGVPTCLSRVLKSGGGERSQRSLARSLMLDVYGQILA